MAAAADKTVADEVVSAAPAAAASDITVELTSKGFKFPMTLASARSSKFLADLIETTVDPTSDIKVVTVPLDHLQPASLDKFVKFVSMSDSDQQSTEKRSKFFEPFYKNIYEIMALMQVANVLDCKDLLTALQEQFLNYYVRKQTPESVLERLGLPKDTKFTKEEEAEAEKEFPWLATGTKA